MITHHFDDENDYKHGGKFKGHYGQPICEWTWAAESRVIEVRCGLKTLCKDLSEFDPAWLTDDELKSRLPDVARDLAKQIMGKELDE